MVFVVSMGNLNSIQKILNRYDYISFDIFDTLVKRYVSTPKQIFEIVENSFGHDVKILDFSRKRIEFEVKAREKKNGEVTLEEIYSYFLIEYPESVVDKYKKREIDCEIAFCFANPDMKRIFEICIRMNKHVLIISDMYLGQDIIETILGECGYTGYDRLYVSSVSGYTKRSGKLFQYVLSELGIPKNKVLHIGDSLRSDIVSSARNRIHSYWVREKRKYGKKNSYLRQDVLSRFCEYSIGNNNPVGFKVYGPLLYGFENWLINRTKGYDYILFFSRDGYLMHQMYNELSSHPVKNRYIHVSRRLLRVSALWLSPDYYSVLTSMYLPMRFTVKWFLSKVGLDYPEGVGCRATIDFDLEYEIKRDEAKAGGKLKEIYEKLKGNIIDNSKKECEAFLGFIIGNQIKGKIAIVDIGWIGNMQKDLISILNHFKIDARVDGFYLGVEPFGKNQDMQKMSGYLYQKNQNISRYQTGIYTENMLELFFTAPHGSASRYYKEKDGEIKIKLDEFEYESSVTYQVIQSWQDGAVDFLRKFSVVGQFLPEDSSFYSQNFYRLFTRPSYREAVAIGELDYWDSEWKKIASPQNLLFYLFHIKKLVSDLIQSPWRIGFLKRLFRLDLRYDVILAKCRRD